MATARPPLPFRPGRRREGSAAVEFALVGPLFLALLFGILQLGYSLVLDAMLEDAASSTARLVRTGQVQKQSITKEQFHADVCARMSVVANDCISRSAVDVRVLSRFSDPVANPMSGAFDPNATEYDPGDASDLVLMRIWFRRSNPLGLPLALIGGPVESAGDGSMLTTTAVAFRNEPWTTSASAP